MLNLKKGVLAVMKEFAGVWLGALAICGLLAQLPAPCGAAGMEGLRASGNNFSLPALTRVRPYQLPDKPWAVEPGPLLPPEVAARVPELGIQLDDWDLWRLEENYNFWRKAGPALWPGVTGVEATPIQLVFPGRYNVLLGHQRPPADCLPFSDRLPKERFCYRKDAVFVHGAFMGDLNGEDTVSINTLGEMDSYGAQVMGAPGYRHDYLANAATQNHELFHAFQNRERKLLPQEAGYPRVSRLDYPDKNPGLNMLLGLEARILTGALDAGGPALRELMRDFMAVRAERYALLSPKARLIAGYMELIEGTAQYISYAVQLGVNPGLVPLPETISDPRFTGYAARDSISASLRPRLAQLHLHQSVRTCVFAYQSGAALALALDRLDPSWKSGLFRTCSGKSCSLDTLVGRLVEPDNTPARLARVKARYEAARLLAESEADLAELLAADKKLIEEFRALPGPRVRLAFPGTPPDDIAVVAPAKLAEYGAERLYRDGCYGVQYAKGLEQYDVEILVKAPGLLDLRSMALELALPAGAPGVSGIKADSVRQSGGETVYEGNVSLDNGVFRWKGDKLAVAASDGGTLLSFYPAK